MRHETFRSNEARALALLRRASVVHLATTTPEGGPVLRALDFAVLDSGIYFHGAPTGEKARCMGRPAVVSAEEVVARIPCWMLDSEDACAAGTLYRSVQVHGTLREVVDPAEKAMALEALMHRWQPEGRYRAIGPADPVTRRELDRTLVFALPFERIDSKEKLLQNRKPEVIARVLQGLLDRNAPGDAAAVQIIREANPGIAAPGEASPQG
jgi:nitroimidazol reductase NimA-like FMN-containing flavoprotein (pyridoxamine 5'-phosphate oxidase superfamily)